MSVIKITESSSSYRHLEQMDTADLLANMNQEDQLVAVAVEKVLPSIHQLVEAVADKMLAGGRLFYIGAGTSGRLGVLDASECPPTFGVPKDLVIGVIAGGDVALRNAVEQVEDDAEQGWQDLLQHKLNAKDIVVGISASGTTPYVAGALKHCKLNGIITGSICSNPNAPISNQSDFPVEVVVGPEFITGSTRLKSGTAQKMVLNMISSAVMIRLGRVEDNEMVHLQLTNEKLRERGVKMVMKGLALNDIEQAASLLNQYGSVKNAIANYRG